MTSFKSRFYGALFGIYALDIENNGEIISDILAGDDDLKLMNTLEHIKEMPSNRDSFEYLIWHVVSTGKLPESNFTADNINTALELVKTKEQKEIPVPPEIISIYGAIYGSYIGIENIKNIATLASPISKILMKRLDKIYKEPVNITAKTTAETTVEIETETEPEEIIEVINMTEPKEETEETVPTQQDELDITDFVEFEVINDELVKV